MLNPVDAEFHAEAVADIYEQAFIDAVLSQDWNAIGPRSCYLAENSVSLSSLERLRDTPVLTVYGEAVDLVIAEVQREDWGRLHQAGWSLEHLQCQGGDHPQTTLFSLPEQLSWLRDRLADRPTGDLCQWTEPVCCAGSNEDACAD